MNRILRNILVGALLVTMWGFLFANTYKLAMAEEPTPEEQPKDTIYLFCGWSQEDFYAIGLDPEEYKSIMKHITWDSPLGGYLLKMPEEYVIIIQHDTGYNSYYINRYDLSFKIVFTINTMGKTVQSNGTCRLANR